MSDEDSRLPKATEEDYTAPDIGVCDVLAQRFAYDIVSTSIASITF
jgi:hypothetical protein